MRRAGIAAAETINSGALIAVLSPLGDLDFIPRLAPARAMAAWVLNLMSGVQAWPAAYVSASRYGHNDVAGEVRWACVAAGLAIGAVVLFGMGFIPIIRAIALLLPGF